MSIEYLGHVINGKGVAMDPKKVSAVLEWPVPKHLKGLRGFLGLTGYYRKFVRHYGSIAKPLTDLTKKDAFGWNTDAQTAFETLKKAITTAPVSAFPDFSLPFVVEWRCFWPWYWCSGTQLLEEARADPGIQKIFREVKNDPQAHPGYYKDRLVIPHSSKFIPSLLKEFHTSLTGGHSGSYRTYRRLATNLYWPGMMAAGQEYVKACDICQRFKASLTAPNGLLQPLDILNAVWEHLSMDFIVGLPKSKGYVVQIHHFWQELFRLQGTALRMSSAYHPKSDGQTEVINRCLETYLHCFAIDQPKSWALWIPWAEFWYNSTFHGSTGRSPFEVVYGQKTPTIVKFIPGEIRVEAVGQELRDRDEALKQLKSQLAKAQAIMKEQADKKRRDIHFQIGEWVNVKLKPYRQMSVAQRIHQKLAARFFGPFKIVEKIGSVAYKLDLPPSSNDMLCPDEICAERTIWENGKEVLQWLIRWKGYTMEEATWEEAKSIRSQFPNPSLEDKTLIAGGSNDTDFDNLSHVGPKPKIWKVYSRKPKENRKGEGITHEFASGDLVRNYPGGHPSWDYSQPSIVVRKSKILLMPKVLQIRSRPLCNAHTTRTYVSWDRVLMVTLPLEKMTTRFVGSLYLAIGVGEQMIVNMLLIFKANSEVIINCRLPVGHPHSGNFSGNSNTLATFPATAIPSSPRRLAMQVVRRRMERLAVVGGGDGGHRRHTHLPACRSGDSNTIFFDEVGDASCEEEGEVGDGGW
ncbi:hypothetical protein OSB04_028140 [Centaurea solstitialis]|uniref:Uncharacterized protein n=1 Tax=Centaurea solstitialis TaxID=347529 RepID=A0AA38SEY7_9ASTR|nr:hypothetical protein OSB04_028140 [Centaurea solstitialis]